MPDRSGHALAGRLENRKPLTPPETIVRTTEVADLLAQAAEPA